MQYKWKHKKVNTYINKRLNEEKERKSKIERTSKKGAFSVRMRDVTRIAHETTKRTNEQTNKQKYDNVDNESLSRKNIFCFREFVFLLNSSNFPEEKRFAAISNRTLTPSLHLPSISPITNIYNIYIYPRRYGTV